MTEFKRRSYQKEILDRDDIPFEDIRRNMKELNFINTHLGGHAITIAGFINLVDKRKEVSICEMGCGGGDNLVAIYNYCNKNKITVRLTGIDINSHCIAYARERLSGKNVNLLASDYRLVDFKDNKPDITFSSLFCHHFTDEELVEILAWMKRNSEYGFFINDLHRHPLAYHFIKYATRLFSKSYMVKNDAPLSVLRGFKKKEWKAILHKAGISNFILHWKWAFRYLVIARVTVQAELNRQVKK